MGLTSRHMSSMVRVHWPSPPNEYLKTCTGFAAGSALTSLLKPAPWHPPYPTLVPEVATLS